MRVKLNKNQIKTLLEGEHIFCDVCGKSSRSELVWIYPDGSTRCETCDEKIKRQEQKGGLK